MNRSKLDYLNSWFKDYTHDFLTGNPEEDVNIQFKIDHTYRVRHNILAIAASLKLNPQDLLLAEVIGLLHDIGRFEQFAKYRTYRDDISEDHAELGLKVLAKLQVLKDLLEDDERNIVETAIKYHNKYLLPQLEAEDCLVLSQLIRDADKLDILEQLVSEDTQNSSTGNEYSQVVTEAIFKGRVVAFSDLKTALDITMMRMSWILDVNYDLTLKMILEKQILERMAAKHPQSTEVQQVYTYLKSYIEQKVKPS